MNLRYPSDIVQPEIEPLHGKKGARASRAIIPTPGAASGTSAHRRGAGTEALAAGRGRQDRLVPAAGGVAGPLALCQGEQELPATNRFVLAWSEVRPFDRLRHLRGSEAALVDLARGTKDIRGLLAMLHDLACKEFELWAETDVDGVCFRDDWGTAGRAACWPRRCGASCFALCTASTAKFCTPRTSSCSSAPTATSSTSSAT